VADTDRLTLETIVTPGAMAPPQTMSDSDLALSFPADTQIYFETREFGASVEMALDGVAELLAAQEMAEGTVDPSDPMAMFADPEALFGEDSPIAAQLGAPLPQLLDFVSDAAVGVGLSSDGAWLGIAGEVNDAAAADDRVDKILGLLTFLTAMDETGTVVVEREMIGDVEVTSITLPLDDALSQGGVPMGVGDTISVALTDDTLLIGLGDFVQSALLAEGTDSLGTSAGYVDALGDQVPNSGVAYVNLGSLLTVLDPMVGAMTPEWAAIQPFAAGLDRIMAVGIGDDDLDGVRIQVIVGQ